MQLEQALKVKKFRNPYQKAMLNVLFTATRLNEQANALLKPYDISEQQYNVLRILRGQQGRPANLYMIQERMIHRMSNATRLVEKLRQKGLVSRELCEHNRRKVDICITEVGLQLLETLDPVIGQFEEEVFQHLSKAEAEQLSTLLDRLRGME